MYLFFLLLILTLLTASLGDAISAIDQHMLPVGINNHAYRYERYQYQRTGI
jgi:hypothetical protein